jgi:hypothetical protein
LTLGTDFVFAVSFLRRFARRTKTDILSDHDCEDQHAGALNLSSKRIHALLHGATKLQISEGAFHECFKAFWSFFFQTLQTEVN